MKIFISYTNADLIRFNFSTLVSRLEQSPEIEHVFYRGKDSAVQKFGIQNMEDSINASDVVIIFCTTESQVSKSVQREIDMAIYLGKRIVPIFQDINEVRLSLRHKRGLQFFSENFDKFLDDLLLMLTERLPESPKQQQIAEFHGIPLVSGEYRAMQRLETQLQVQILPIEPLSLPVKIKVPSKFRPVIGFAAKNNHVAQFNLVGGIKVNVLPEGIGSLTHLQILRFVGQGIKVLPPLIENLHQLEYLDLRSNKISELPLALTKLTKLQVLLLNSPERGLIYRPFNFQRKGIKTLSSRNLKVLSAILEFGCKLDNNCITPLNLGVLYHGHSPFFCAKCGTKIDPQPKDFKTSDSYRCPKCNSDEFYGFLLEERDAKLGRSILNRVRKRSRASEEELTHPLRQKLIKIKSQKKELQREFRFQKSKEAHIRIKDQLHELDKDWVKIKQRMIQELDLEEARKNSLKREIRIMLNKIRRYEVQQEIEIVRNTR